jgi:P-type Cu2+ transporter
MSLVQSGDTVSIASAREKPASEPFECSHCGLPVPTGLIEPDADQQFCCAGCRAVYAAIHARGLDRYYRILRDSPGKAAPARPTGRPYQELDTAEFLDAHAPRVAPGLRCIELYLQGVHCSACVWLVEKLPRVAPGVIESRLDLGRALVKVVWQEDKTDLSNIAQTLDSLGYTPHVGRDAVGRDLRKREDRQLLAKIAIAGAGAGNVMLLAFALYGGSFHGMEHQYSSLFRWTSLVIGLVVLLGPGSLFFRGAIAALRTRTAHLDLPIAIGLAAGGIAGTVNTLLDRGDIYFDSLTGLVFLLLVGRYIQRRLERRAADAVELLFSLTPSFAHLREGDLARDVPIEALEIDHVVEVRPGESFPVDGWVIEGDSSVDVSLLTGESRPVPAQLKDKIFAGSINVDRPLLVRVSALGRDTRVGKLLALMEECAQRKAPIVQMADRVAGYFTLGALFLFAVTLVTWYFIDARHAVDHAVSLLIVSCPCGLGLATPFAVSVALGRAARASILVKGGEVLEKLSVNRAQAPMVFLDKTGTLTEPGLSVLEWHGEPDVESRHARAVAALEAQVSHPIARALANAASHLPESAASVTTPMFDDGSGAASITPVEVQLTLATRSGIAGVVNGANYVIGSQRFVASSLGDTCDDRTHADYPSAEVCGRVTPEWASDAHRQMTERCLTPVWVAVDGAVSAVMGVGSRPRTDAASTIVKLRRRGLRAVILSGDDAATVAAVGRELGIVPEDCRGDLSPEEKLQIVQDAKVRGPVLMVGDGINDAAALSAATVGIAVHGGAEASLAAADAYLGRAGVGVFVELLDGARRTMGVIRRCLFVSLAYNAVAASLAMTGYVNALAAAVLMPLASFTVLGIALSSKTFETAKLSSPVRN